MRGKSPPKAHNPHAAILGDAHYAATMEPLLMRALDLAENGMVSTPPNPRVGCIIYRDGKIIGDGWHQRAGEPHAEVIAAQELQTLRGAEVFVSLEPCAHQGRTPSCANMIAAAKPARVIAALPDPNPKVAGRGFATLRAAGIPCIIASPQSLPWQRALSQNIGFVSRMIRRRPWLRLKIATTADGKTALSNGLSQWISSEAARIDAHHIRARSCALLTGIGTARTDNPQLTVRHVKTPRQPLRILIDRDLSASENLAMFRGGALIVTAQKTNRHLPPEVKTICHPGADGKVNLPALMHHLAERDINEVTVEAGRRLCGAFMHADLVDEIVVYQSPSFFGGGMDMIEMPPPPAPAQAVRFNRTLCVPVGDDTKMVFENPQSRDMIDNAMATLYRTATSDNGKTP